MSASPEATRSRAVVSSVEEAVTYPILTREVGSDLGMRPNGSAPNGGSLNQVAQQTLRDLLGWRYRSQDAAGFTAALTKAFTPKQIDGYTQWEWQSQTFSLQADLGEITGAQASIHAQARNAVDHILPLLDGLKPLRADVDSEDSEAIRGITRSALQEIVRELAARSGPRVQRIDLYFKGLLSKHPVSDSAYVGGYLGQLRKRFGLDSSRVNTVEEERNLTNFIVMVDELFSLWMSWGSKRGFFTRDHFSLREPYLGTRLVQLSEALDVIVEQVHETYAGMDSVFFGASERQAALLPLGMGAAGNPHQTPITVADLLSWVESFASGEGRQLLQNSGKDGVMAFHDTIKPISRLVKAAADLSKFGKDTGLPAAFHTRRVGVLLDGLASHTKNAAQLANDIQRSAEMPDWIRRWLLTEVLRNPRFEVRRWPTPQNGYHDDRNYVDVDIGDDQIQKAALHLLLTPEGKPPQHKMIDGTVDADQTHPNRIYFDQGDISSEYVYDLVLLTANQRVILVDDAVEFKQILTPRVLNNDSAARNGATNRSSRRKNANGRRGRRG